MYETEVDEIVFSHFHHPMMIVWRRYRMAASVTSSAYVFVFLLVCPVFSYIPAISFTREELLNIRQNAPQDVFSIFNYSDVLLNVVIGGAAALIKRFRTRRRGKRAGALVRLRKRGFRTPLPALYPTKQTNSFCSLGQIRISHTLLLCVSRKPG